MSEAELHWLRSRLLGGKLEKAQQGQLRMRLPVGLVYDPAHHVVLDPDEQVQHAVRLVFDLFEQTGTALAVVKQFQDQHLRFPNRLWGGPQDGQVDWELLRHGRVLSLLHNPAYAGVYVYGRTQTRTRPLPGEAPRLKGRTRRIQPDAKRGRLSCTMSIRATFPGSSSYAIKPASTTIAPFGAKTTVGRRAKARRCFKGLSCAVCVAAG